MSSRSSAAAPPPSLPPSPPTDDRRLSLDRLAITLILACCAIWGANQVVMKVTLSVVPPLMQGALRSTIAAVLVGLWARHRGIALWPADGVNASGIVAGVLFALEFCCLYGSVQYTSASRVIVFLYLAPFLVAAGMPLIAPGERLRPAQVAGLVLAFSALVFTFRGGLTGGGGDARTLWLGDLLALAAAALWGLTTLWIRATPVGRAAPERTLFQQLAVSAPLMAIGSWLMGEPAPQWTSPLAIASLFYQSVVIAFFSYLAWFWLLRHYPAARVSAFTFLTPVLGLLAGVVLLDEQLTVSLLIGLAGVAVGLWLVNRPTAPATRSRTGS